MQRLVHILKGKWFFATAIIYVRFLTGFAFIFASPVKILGDPFTTISTEHPVGYFFDALHRTGLYWQFLGTVQFVTGVLLLIQRLTAISAILFTALMSNIFMITISIDFGKGTPTITGLMLLASFALIVWDYERLHALLIRSGSVEVKHNEYEQHPLWLITGVIFLVLTLTLQLTKGSWALPWAILMLLIGFIAMFYGWRVWKKEKPVTGR